MKVLICNKCKAYLGEIEKGKIKKGVILICAKCRSKNKPLDNWLSDLLSGRRTSL